ncbi:MAG: uracil-DNA glycosylase [Candidatus Babeliales bacterium]
MDIKQFKQYLLNKLYEPYLNCVECPLGTLGRTTVVFGDGNPDARIMIIGEAPGKNEDEGGKPFIGRAGKVLDEGLKVAGINREDVFITNVVKCRPPKNRKPKPIESGTCKNLLLFNQIKIIQPSIIITLGATPYEALLEKKDPISSYRGKLHQVLGIDLLPTFHPAYILRNPKARDLLYVDIISAANIAKKLPAK